VATLAWICRIAGDDRAVHRRLQRGAEIGAGQAHHARESALRVSTSRLFESLIRRHAMPRGSRFTTGASCSSIQGGGVLARFQEHKPRHFALVA